MEYYVRLYSLFLPHDQQLTVVYKKASNASHTRGFWFLFNETLH